MVAGEQRLAGKTAIVTGGGTSGPGVGTGRAISVLFARAGARVLIVDLVEEHARRTLDEIEADGGEASVVQADVTSAGDCEAAVMTAVERYGALHILVNNVGIGARGSVIDVSEADWDRTFDVNLKSMMLTSKFAIPRIVASGGGSIINISALGAIRGLPRSGGVVAYAASKGGVIAMTTSMAVAHGADGVRVNCILPGHLLSPMVLRNPRGLSQEERTHLRLSAPLETEGDGWDVGWAAVYLASDEARWVTGIALPVDAGLSAKLP